MVNGRFVVVVRPAATGHQPSLVNGSCWASILDSIVLRCDGRALALPRSSLNSGHQLGSDRGDMLALKTGAFEFIDRWLA